MIIWHCKFSKIFFKFYYLKWVFNIIYHKIYNANIRYTSNEKKYEMKNEDYRGISLFGWYYKELVIITIIPIMAVNGDDIIEGEIDGVVVAIVVVDNSVDDEESGVVVAVGALDNVDVDGTVDDAGNDPSVGDGGDGDVVDDDAGDCVISDDGGKAVVEAVVANELVDDCGVGEDNDDAIAGDVGSGKSVSLFVGEEVVVIGRDVLGDSSELADWVVVVVNNVDIVVGDGDVGEKSSRVTGKHLTAPFVLLLIKSQNALTLVYIPATSFKYYNLQLISFFPVIIFTCVSCLLARWLPNREWLGFECGWRTTLH